MGLELVPIGCYIIPHDRSLMLVAASSRYRSLESLFALTRKTDYAIIALSHMAGHEGSVCNAREIAERYRVPTALLMNVLKTLCH